MFQITAVRSLSLCWLLCGAMTTLGASTPSPGADGTLYSRLGGPDGVAAITSQLIDRAASDPVLGRSFKDSNLGRIKRLLAEQICELSAGPCRYSGDSMREVHAGHHITQADFYGLVSLLKEILAERHVGLATTNQLLRLLAPMKRDIVESSASTLATNVPEGSSP